MSDESTQIALNKQGVGELKKQNELLFQLNRELDGKLNKLLLGMENLSTNSEWLKSTVENHIKHSVDHIDQINKNENCNLKQGSHIKIQWFLITGLTTGLFSMAFFIIRSKP